MIAKESPEMTEASEKLIEISADKQAQAYADSRDYAMFAKDSTNKV